MLNQALDLFASVILRLVNQMLYSPQQQNTLSVRWDPGQSEHS